MSDQGAHRGAVAVPGMGHLPVSEPGLAGRAAEPTAVVHGDADVSECELTVDDKMGFPIWLCLACGEVWSTKNTADPATYRPDNCVERKR